MIEISILYPSRQRAKECEATLKKWIDNMADRNNAEIILSCDKTCPDLRRYKHLGLKYGAYVAVNKNKSAIEAINHSAKVSNGRILVVVSDDFNEPPLHWDKSLIEMLKGKEDFAAKTEDVIQATMLTLPIIDRKYYERFGFVYDPRFSHLFADTQMTAIALMLGRYIKLPLYIPHNHHSVGKSKKDALNVRNNKTWKQGESIFYSDLKNNFGIENPVINYSDIQW